MFAVRRAAVAFPSNTFTPIIGLARQQHMRMQTTKPVTTPLRVIKPESAQEELARQRLWRPVAPHLSIYKWQVHSVSSALDLYLFGTSYLVAPWLGLDLSSASLVAAFGSLPVVAKVLLKSAVAWPFTFHLFDSIRYVVSSTGYTLNSRSQFIKIAWAVVGSSALAAVGLVAYV
ncbi:putative cytochrome b subunit of succinate dehydrogenase [Aspergillus leporis]|uniref:Putative cytochrome b subunit of succinate dehydrogenase n=1 Tax=Aspergillus leporis TaxID=41062 RepID=A0A5N5XBL9_9EURO|nr:putative cytochrome b subunit of succinate dehydrogenase [Aspergillus leporis]